MDDNNMYDNWSEIIAIMKTVINHGGSRAELRIAVESTLRTLGWRATTGSMKTDFTTKSGRKIDIVLGEKQLDNVSAQYFLYMQTTSTPRVKIGLTLLQK